MEYATSEEVRAALRTLCAALPPAADRPEARLNAVPAAADRADAAPGSDGSAAEPPWIDVPPYQGDALVRGSDSLSKTKDGQIARVEF
jgi:hypothetical protein